MENNNVWEPHFLDYDDRTELHTVVDKQDGVYLGHPSTAMLKDGKTIFVVYPKSHGFGQIVLKKSTDGGKTWSQRLEVPDNFSTNMECPTIFRMEDASGKSRLMIFSGRYPFRMSVSEDDGNTFSPLKPIGAFGGFFMSSMISFGNGHYMAFFHDEGAYIKGGKDVKNVIYRAGTGNDVRTRLFSYISTDGGKTYPQTPKAYWKNSTTDHEGDIWEPVYENYEGQVFPDKHFEVYTTETFDGGLTWSSPKMILTHPVAKFCEPCVFFSPDKSEIAVLLRDNSRLHNSFVTVSRDGGKSWSTPREVCNSLTGDRHMATYLDDGRLLVSLRSKNSKSDIENNWVAWVGSYDDMVSGNAGDCRILLKRHYYADDEQVFWDCAYPCIDKVGDGEILLTTYGKWEKDKEHYIMSVHLTKEEINKIPYKI